MQAVFSETDFKIAISRDGEYIASANLWWQSVHPSFSSNVPLDVARVEELGEFLFAKGPRYLPTMVEVMVTDENEALMTRKGSWRRISPEEVIHAVLFKCAQRIKDLAPADELAQSTCALAAGHGLRPLQVQKDV